MSQLPPQVPPHGDPLSYDSPNARPRSSGMAIASLVLGILSVPLMCAFGLGVLTAIVGIVLGILAIAAINRNPMKVGGKGLASAGMAASAGSFLLIPLMIAMLLPSLGKARELSNRSVCAANLRGISQSMNIYAADNNDAYPIISKVGGYSLASGGTGTPQADADKTILSLYKSPEPSVTQNMWLLVLTGQVAPKQFLCKSDPAPTIPASAAVGADYQINFNNGSGAPSDYAYSYSFAYPWTQTREIGGWWKNMTDASLPVIGDMNPLAGTGSPAASPHTPTGREANSFTHQRDGQNIGYGDGHAEFLRLPNVGQSNDNVYSSNGGVPSPAGAAFGGGAVPAVGKGGTAGNWDIVLVPAADGNAKYLRK
jgi:hypothetical protein